MDVSATAPVTVAAASQENTEVDTGAQAASTTPVPSPLPAQSAGNRSAIAPAIAKLFGSITPPEPIRLDVSYRVLRHPDEIVTVFTDPKTGEEVAQFPPDILIGLAEFFDQQSGVTLDRDA